MKKKLRLDKIVGKGLTIEIESLICVLSRKKIYSLPPWGKFSKWPPKWPPTSFF